MLQYLSANFQKDLDHLQQEVLAYRDETKLWITQGEVNNSAGNLALHLVGNLNHFVGHHLGKTGYVRNREAEFNLKNVPAAAIADQIGDTATMVSQVLAQLSLSDLDETYPLEVFGKPMTTGYFLMHLLGHLNYHKGQISYHRRLLDQ